MFYVGEIIHPRRWLSQCKNGYIDSWGSYNQVKEYSGGFFLVASIDPSSLMTVVTPEGDVCRAFPHHFISHFEL